MGGMWGRYVPVSERRQKAKNKMEKLKKQGRTIEPIEIEGKLISTKFWGKKWCEHLNTFADYDNRLSRGKTYVRNGSICHLSIEEGKCEAYVSGSELYSVTLHFKPLAKSIWEKILDACRGKVGSLLELLQGKLSDHVMEIVTSHENGLFPKNKEITFSCSCPDWADMCKHVAAVCYGIGHRLDTHPELLFKLRGVDPSALISSKLIIDTEVAESAFELTDLGSIFGIDLEAEVQVNPVAPKLESQPKKVEQKVIKAKKNGKEALDPENLTGNKLKAYRKKKQLTVLEFARLLNVTSASIYRWEGNGDDILKLNGQSKEAIKLLSNH